MPGQSAIDDTQIVTHVAQSQMILKPPEMVLLRS